MIEKVYTIPEDPETIWNYSKYHIGDWAEMYTTDQKIMKCYEDFMRKFPDHCCILREDKYSMTFSVDPKCMGFKPRAPRKGPNLSEEQKQVNSKRLESLRMLKKKD